MRRASAPLLALVLATAASLLLARMPFATDESELTYDEAPEDATIEIDEDGVLYAHVLDASHPGEVVADARRLQRELLSRILAAVER